MTYGEAIKVFRKPSNHIRTFLVEGIRTVCYSTSLEEAFEMAISALEEIQQYRAIGTIERFRELTEKAEPKKPIVVERHCFGYIHKIYRCYTCDNKLVSQIDGDWCGGTLSKHCEECGTAIDWE